MKIKYVIKKLKIFLKLYREIKIKKLNKFLI
jgi:hypothetical protein